ncbi:GNAT family N-acetyltransferase [Candidatus Bathyarchaeota archaeon]|nr:GNAT family N-acetyltransferase [Candidatus Bathyarchaeota archaeon]
MINGKQIDLKPFGIDDYEFLYRWNNDPEYTGRFEPFEPITDEELREWLHGPKKGQSWYIIQAKDGRKMGQLVARQLADATLSIGYRVIPSERNKGHCTAAVKTAVDHYLSEPGTERITAEANPENQPSRRVLEKTGFIETNYKEKAVEVNGVWMSGVVYTLTREEWTLYSSP